MRRPRAFSVARGLLLLLAVALALGQAQAAVVCVGEAGHVALETPLAGCEAAPATTAPGDPAAAVADAHRHGCRDLARGQLEPPTRPASPAPAVASLPADPTDPSASPTPEARVSVGSVMPLAGRSTVLRL